MKETTTDNNNNNNKTKITTSQVKWTVYIVVMVGLFYGWVRAELSVKADSSIVNAIGIRQEKQSDILQDIKQRLIRIETKLEK